MGMFIDIYSVYIYGMFHESIMSLNRCLCRGARSSPWKRSLKLTLEDVQAAVSVDGDWHKSSTLHSLAEGSHPSFPRYFV